MRLAQYIIILLAFIATGAQAQSITGDWYGIGHVKKKGNYNSYLSEMVLTQKGNKVTGIFKYFFKSDSIKVKVTGTYDAKYKRLELLASPILNFQAKNSNGADCPMEGGFTLKTTAKETTLTGQFNPTFDYRYICPAIDIHFVKYVEPYYEEEESDSTEQIDKVNTPVFSNKPATNSKDINVIKTIDSLTLAQEALNKRKFELSPIIDVEADSLQINFYDNGEIDNDSISVFVNRKPTLLKQQLSKEPISLTVKLDSTVTEIALFAENLGIIAPNTAVAIIYAGEQRFELNLTSSFTSNSTIRFRKKVVKKDPRNIN